LLNLAVNARDAMSSGGRLAISTRNVSLRRPNTIGLDGDFIAVSVSDSGAGIPPEFIGRVFEPFFTTKEVGKGTGLGLSQVYGFARQAGGAAAVESKVGRGTTVTLYLPRSLEPVDPEVAVSDGSTRKAARERGRVLLVEDNHDVAEVTRGLLEELGYTVVLAFDVASARTSLRGPAKVHVVLTDIVMPGGADGLDLARWIRQEGGDMPAVILATGYSDKAQSATDEGFTILRKPYDVTQLRNALAEALKNARHRGAA
jgi:two-component system NtrC family sensor kinase